MGSTTGAAKILLVDDNDQVRTTLKTVLEASQFQVKTAANVSEALHLIDTELFDVLLCDLHMPGAGDGFTVVSAMRHTNPDAVTLVFTGYPALEEAMKAILLQADEILVKPLAMPTLLKLIREKLQRQGTKAVTCAERVASILERDSALTIENWLQRVEQDKELNCITLDREQRLGMLPQLVEGLICRLRAPRGAPTQPESSAIEHGRIRQSQGYTIPMLIEESRLFQTSMFQTLQNNLATVDFSALLGDVITIADEVDQQLKLMISSFMGQAAKERAA